MATLKKNRAVAVSLASAISAANNRLMQPGSAVAEKLKISR
jgi:hypothetical protein